MTSPTAKGPRTEASDVGDRALGFIREVQPHVRSITGPGLRQTLEAIQERIPIEIVSVPSGQPVLDWTIPPEWRLRDAWIADSKGQRVLQLADSPLRVMSYSVAIHSRLTLDELRPHLFTLPDRPDWIPYRTSYYQEDWGFCLQHSELEALPQGEYEVCIDAELDPTGELNYGELLIPGRTTEEVLVSCHCCHPGTCNDNLSGIAVAIELARALLGNSSRYSYRFVFVPGTIGSIAWLARNESTVDRIKHGLVLAGVGDDAPFTYKLSRQSNAPIDRVMRYLLSHSDGEHRVMDFEPYGYDERQYCSPGFDLPVGCLMRSKHGTYPEYHTSADNIEFVRSEKLGSTVQLCRDAFALLEANQRYLNLSPKGEPQLGKRGLYRALGGLPSAGAAELAMLWILSYSDGEHDLLDIAQRSGLPFGSVRDAARVLEQHQLLRLLDSGAKDPGTIEPTVAIAGRIQ
jgi:aminopeptidase-like protein